MYAWDHFFSTVLIWNAVVLVWRATWGLTDIYLLPESEISSAWTSVGVGIALILLSIPLQIGANKLFTSTKSFVLRVLLEEAVSIIMGIGTVVIWRGIWYVYDLYLLPDSWTLSCWVSHSCTIFVLYLALSGSSILSKGCATSGDTEKSLGCVNNIEYFQYFFKVSHEKQPHKQNKEVHDGAMVSIGVDVSTHF